MTLVFGDLRAVQGCTAIPSRPRAIQGCTAILSKPRTVQGHTAILDQPRAVQGCTAFFDGHKPSKMGVIRKPRFRITMSKKAMDGFILTVKERKKEPAISRVLSWTIIHLGQSSPTASSNLPGSPLRHAVQAVKPAYPPIWSCSRRGLPCRDVLPRARCALTAPFHPYRR